jgi:hypothetical protein
MFAASCSNTMVQGPPYYLISFSQGPYLRFRSKKAVPMNSSTTPPPRFKCISPSKTQHRKEDYVTPTVLSLSISPSFKESSTAPCFMIFLPLSRLRYLRTEGVWDIPRGSTNENQKHEASRARAQHLPLPAASNEVSTIRRKGAV